jgi:hypothetical protein
MISVEQIKKVRAYLDESAVRYDPDVELSQFSYFRSGGGPVWLFFPVRRISCEHSFSSCLKMSLSISL